jgi:putative oxidoreductase
MKTLDIIDNWSEKHPFLPIDLLRIGLGGVLLWKGIVFGQNQKDIQVIIDNGPFDFLSLLLVQYVVIAQIAGGVLIMIGLITRGAALFQIPILCWAVIYSFVSSSPSFYSNGVLAFVVLLLLIGFLLYGSGKFSADEYLKRHPNG